ncbi:NAD(P)-dependent oxidoreductase [Nocardioides mangrovicus]|uniref:NAD(P)-dependent oxidoreductase n=1 Tax=Nocardioides mangrovicus TaxID=2478913 RepID=A0A3L8NZD2_9ACTN|nr:mycofactocin-coupled SDR family oxidoreductase [Nocardioides mangrovicus]RLV47458.1 NAD(P)-dependent oxidoreductase [Nocardioides mangrovicus]
MAGRLEGKVAFITGAARGQGRSHAVKLAEEGADIIAVDIAADIQSVPYPVASPEDLAETVRQVEALDRRIVASETDVRNSKPLMAAVAEGVARLGRLDIVVANAGIWSYGRMDEMSEQTWQDMLDVNLTGVWHAAKAAIPHLRTTGGGSIVLTSSIGGLRGSENAGHYVAAKHGVVGLMRTLAWELARDAIRVNSVHPTQVNTDMIQNDVMRNLFAPDVEVPSQELFAERSQATHLLQIPWVEPIDISNAVAFLVSDDARYITGVTLPIDAGAMLR